jgi:hypothetical protein
LERHLGGVAELQNPGAEVVRKAAGDLGLSSELTDLRKADLIILALRRLGKSKGCVQKSK